MSNGECDWEESFGNDKLSRADPPPPPPTRRGVTCSCGNSKDVDPILSLAQLAVTDRGMDRALLVGVVDWTGVNGGVGGIRDRDKGPPSNRGGGICRGMANAL
jgi:hypothetical protein